jgi:hypothetical protein
MKRLLFIVLIVTILAIIYAPIDDIFYIAESSPCIRGFNNYSDDLGYFESRNDTTIVNKIGCFAEHQWKQSTLRYLGYNITLKKFKKDPSIFPRSMQREALKTLIDTTKFDLESYKYYIGTIIDGVYISESGLLAACHLGGAKSVKKYLLSNGTYILIDGLRLDIKHSKCQVKSNSKDIFGTSVKDYIKQFAGYNI